MPDYSELGYDKNLNYLGASSSNSEDESGATLDALESLETDGSSDSPGTSTDGVKTNTAKETIDPSALGGGDLLAQLNMAQFSYIKGGADGYNEGSGFYLGWDAGLQKYVFFFGDSSGDNIRYDGTNLTITGGLNVSEIHIPDEDTTDNSFHVNTSGDAWWATTQTDFNADNYNARAFVLNNGNAYFQNAQVNGTIQTTVFEKDVVSAVGGQLMVANADVLDADMTALDTADLTIKGETTFAVNDILHIKDGTDEEYLRVTSIASAPTYDVTRDLAGAYGANANPAWKTGTAVVVEGKSDGVSTYSGGYLRLLGAGTNAPRYGVFKRTGVAYNAITEYIGMGNLNGLLDYSSEEYGILVGTEADGYMSFDPTNGLRINAQKIALNQRFEAGMDLEQGDVVAIESDGLSYRPRLNDFSADQINLVSGGRADTTSYNMGESVIVGYRDTFNLYQATLCSVYDKGGTSYISYTTINADTLALGTTTETSITAGRTASRICEMTDTSAIVVNFQTTTSYAKYITGLDGTPTINAEATVSTNALAPHVARFSDTEAVCVYYDSSDFDLKVRELSISGTTITAGSATTLYTGTVGNVFNIKRLGNSNYYAVTFFDSSASDSKIICFEFDGSTFTAGTAVDIVTGTSNIRCDLDWLNETKIAVTYKQSTTLYAVIVTRSGTTLTVDTPVSLDTTASASNYRTSLTRLGQDSFILAFAESTSAGDMNMDIMAVRVTGNTPAQLGSTIVSFDNRHDTGGAQAPANLFKFGTRFWGLASQDTGDDYDINIYGTDNTLDQVIGICAEDTTSGNMGGVVMQGYSDDVSGLTTATPYYSDLDGMLTTREDGGTDRIGIALSATSFKIEK